jgi:hypothetical protein
MIPRNATEWHGGSMLIEEMVTYLEMTAAE